MYGVKWHRLLNSIKYSFKINLKIKWLALLFSKVSKNAND